MLVILPSPISKLQHAPLPPKCYKPKSVPRLLALPMFSVLDSHLSLSRSWDHVTNSILWAIASNAKTKFPKSATTTNNLFCPWQTPSKVFMALKSKKQWEKTHGLLKGLCYIFSAGNFIPSVDVRFIDCKIKDTPQTIRPHQTFSPHHCSCWKTKTQGW